MIETRPDAVTIAELIGPGSIFGPIEVVDSTGSTNADLAMSARRGERPGKVLISREQTAGRGRLARQWVSPSDASISMSMLLEPSQPATSWGWLSLLAGMAVRGALRQLAPEGVTVSLKWPNDVLLDGKKVCGILAERLEYDRRALAVVGLGINLTLTGEQLPVPNATSLLLCGFSTTANAVISGVLIQFERLMNQWEMTGSLREEYRAQCASIGAELTVSRVGGDPVEGIGYDVDVAGCLQVRSAHGMETFAVGDVVHARMA